MPLTTPASLPYVSEEEIYSRLLADMQRIRQHITDAADDLADLIATLHPTYRASARNLLHYLSLRQFDLHLLQARLVQQGLAPLTELEASVLPRLDAVLRVLYQLEGHSPPLLQPFANPLPTHTADLLGTASAGRTGHLLVSLPMSDEAFEDALEAALRAGADGVRLDGTQGTAECWRQRIAYVRATAEAAQRSCRLLFELSGPKLRTVLLDGGRPPRLMADDHICLVNPAQPVLLDEVSFHIGCTLPEVFVHLTPGETVLFHNGKLEGQVVAATAEWARIRITRCRPGGRKLRHNRNIYFPAQAGRTRGLTTRDRAMLEQVVPHADLVSLAYVNEPEDVQALLQTLPAQGPTPGVLLKIETLRGLQQLPRLLLVAQQHYPVGVLFDQDELASEGGWERLSAMRAEAEALCAAAHVPLVMMAPLPDQKARQDARAALVGGSTAALLPPEPPPAGLRQLDQLLRQTGWPPKAPSLRSLRLHDLLENRPDKISC